MDDLTDRLNNARLILTAAALPKFPIRISDHRSFDPAPPSEFDVEFYIDGSELVCSVHILRVHNKRPEGYRSLIHGWVDPPQVMYEFYLLQNYISITSLVNMDINLRKF